MTSLSWSTTSVISWQWSPAQPARAFGQETVWQMKSNSLGLFPKVVRTNEIANISNYYVALPLQKWNIFYLYSSIRTFFERGWHKMLWTLLADTAAKLCASPRNHFSSWEDRVLDKSKWDRASAAHWTEASHSSRSPAFFLYKQSKLGRTQEYCTLLMWTSGQKARNSLVN